jgi:hypothetical protein
MLTIEVTTFHLAEGVDEATFLEADQRVQNEFFYTQLGLVRRTTARGADGEWLVVTLWGSADDAEAASTAAAIDPLHTAFMALVDRDTYSAKRFVSLD